VADQFDALSPRDAVITIRSLGRRFDEVSGAARSDQEVFERLDAAGPDGRSLPDIVISASQELAFLGNEVERALDRSEPVVPRAVVDDGERHFEGAAGRATMTDAVAAITDETQRLGDRLDRLEPTGWGRSASVVGGGRVQVLELAREVARTGVRHLRAAQDQLEWLRETAS
jgi:hypothetical protein